MLCVCCLFISRVSLKMVAELAVSIFFYLFIRNQNKSSHSIDLRGTKETQQNEAATLITSHVDDNFILHSKRYIVSTVR